MAIVQLPPTNFYITSETLQTVVAKLPISENPVITSNWPTKESNKEKDYSRGET